MNIAITGKMCAGKTTLANHIKDKFPEQNYVVNSFSTKVKDIAKDLFGMRDKDRILLQQIGTKMREIRDDVWINYIFNKNYNNVIIDDVRYVNELKIAKKINISL